MFNDLIFSGLISALILISALAACLLALCLHLHKEKLAWVKRYAGLLEQIDKANKDALNNLIKSLEADKTSLYQTPYTPPESSH